MLVGLFSLSAFSQNESVNASLGYGQTYNLYTGVASDTIGDSDSTWSYIVQKLTDEKVFPYAYISLDSLGGTAADVTVLLKYKMFDSQSFTTSTTVTYAGTIDTTIVISPGTAIKADYWQLLITGSTDGFNVGIDKFDLKLIK